MRTRYTIAESRDGWTISVDGAMVLICKSRDAALQAVQDAQRDTCPRAWYRPHDNADPPSQPVRDRLVPALK